jgi:alpha-glucoside transport system permease protein
VALTIAILWTIPTFGLAVSSFRPERDIQQSGWWTFFTNPEISFKNYQTVLAAEGQSALGSYFVNSFVIVIPSVFIPLVLASFAAYIFAWVKFPGRDLLFIVVFALQIVPIQVTLLPLLKLFVDIDLSGTFWPVWLSHSTFALPLAIFLLHNFMKEIPAGLLEAARVDGAGHVAIFFRVLLPLLTPALAAFGIFQFLWTWNDLLVALTFAGGGPDTAPITVALANLSGTRGNAWHLLSAGAFVSIIVPVVVFLALQRYFVRGLLAGGLKG